jgi:hypothetical protein
MLPADLDLYVPQEGDEPFAGNWDHGQPTHDEDGSLTEYGRWWAEDRFPELVQAATQAIARAERDLGAWQAAS